MRFLTMWCVRPAKAPTPCALFVSFIVIYKALNEYLTITWAFGSYHILANISDPSIVHADAVELAILIVA